MQGVELRVEAVSLLRPKLDDLSFTLDAGQKLAIIGPNGAGKSTLLTLLAGWQKPSQGQIQLAGKAISSYSRQALAQQLAVLEQQHAMDYALTVADVLALARLPFKGQDPKQQVAQAIETFQLQPLLTQPLARLSGGEQQRVMMARAMAQGPSLLILDEPTNHLDIQFQLQLLQSVLALPTTLVACLHDLNYAARFDQVLVIKAGQQLAFGEPHKVLTHELIAQTFGVQSRIQPCPVYQTPNFTFSLGETSL